MRSVFADSFYFTGLINKADQHHKKITTFAAGHDGGIVTTEWVLAEFANALSGSRFRDLARGLIEDLNDGSEYAERAFSQSQLSAGLKLHKERPDKAWSLTDCISFVTMRVEGLGEALTGDRHFTQAGFKALLR